MIREIDRLTGLVEQLLQLSPHARFDLRPLNVHKVLTDVLLLERETIPEGIRLITQFDPSLPDVLGDESQLAQVFRNLIRNSLQALHRIRGGVLTISTRMATDFHILRSSTPPAQPVSASFSSSERLSRFLTVDFADNGPGIDPEHLSQLFTPFFTTKTHGTGLGLATSQRIIVQHGGTLRVESIQGQGALFHVLLPVSSPSL
jgi:two-component system nitrogen regulation sensor histidine kinase GlnL